MVPQKMPRALGDMSESASTIAEKVENQLAQVILYLGGIEELSALWRSSPELRQDPFLFGTVYEALWDGLIVRFGAIWDSTKGVASIPQLSVALRRIGSSEAKSVAARIDAAKSAERERVTAWRNKVIAHRQNRLDANAFDLKNPLSHSDLRDEAERVESLLASANNSIGRSKVYYEVLKEDASTNAKMSLGRWRNIA